jgi:hypothetical protein
MSSVGRVGAICGEQEKVKMVSEQCVNGQMDLCSFTTAREAAKRA